MANQQNLSAEYDLEATPTPAPEPSELARATPPRDPSTGQFIKPHNHPARTVRMAKDLGFSEEEIATMPTAELRQAVSEAAVERLYNQQAQTISRAIEPQVRTPAQVAPQATEPLPQTPVDEEFNLKAEDYDEGLFGVVKKLWDRVKQLEASTKEFGEVANHVRASAEQTVTQQIDGEFAKHPDLFGNGGLADLDKNGPDMARRRAVVAYANSLPEGTAGQKVAKAIATLYPAAKSKTAKPESREAVTPEVERWLNGGLAQPTHRSGANEPDGPAKAAATVAAYYRENGLASSQPTAVDEFPE